MGAGDNDGVVGKLFTADVALAGQPMKIKIIIWMYFDGYIMSGDKFGNLNLAYIGRKLGLQDWVTKNPTTTDDAEDSFWLDYGFKMVSEGR